MVCAKLFSAIINKTMLSLPQMRICRLKAASEEEEDVDDTSDEEEVDENDSDDGEIRSSCEEEEEEEEDEEKRASREKAGSEHPSSSETVQLGVTPFMSRVLPAGILQAKRKPMGSNTVGLVQVRHRRGGGGGGAGVGQAVLGPLMDSFKGHR